MKKILPYIIVVVFGMVVGWLCRGYHFREEVKMVESDTVYVYKYKSYSHLDLKGGTYKLDVPVVGVPDVIFIREDSTAVEYRDSIRYITAPREYYYTKVDDAEIFHSGIDSRIDSLNVFSKATTITERVQPVRKRNVIEFGLEADYSTMLSLPLHLEYSYVINDWLSVYGYGEYELFHKQFGIGGGTKVQFAW